MNDNSERSVTNMDDDDNDDDVSTDLSEVTSDMSDLSNSHYQGIVLLQKLQQLKVWQAAQEELLLNEQRKQINIRMEELDLTDKDISQTDGEAHNLDDNDFDNNTENDEPIETLDIESYEAAPVQEKFIVFSAQHHEEQPVAGAGKTFEQLLAQHLGNEESSTTSSAGSPKMQTPKPFLRKKSGLARFKLNSDPGASPEKVTPVTATNSYKKKSPSGKVGSDRKVSSKLVESSEKKSKHVSIMSPPKTLRLFPKVSSNNSTNKFNPSDSVENSFCDKLVVQASRQEKDSKELAVFQMLENAANDTSFCSNSSRIQSLINGAVLQSPHRQVAQLSDINQTPGFTTKSFLSSTPAPGHTESYTSSTPAIAPVPQVHPPDKISSSSDNNFKSSVDPTPASMAADTNHSLGESIMEDIKKFLAARLVAESQTQEHVADDYKDDSEWTDESDDDTLEQVDDKMENESIGKNWKENIPPEKPKSITETQLLTYSPPEKLPPNPPSQLIWEIFGRENQKKRQELVKNKSSSVPRRKSAPLGVRFNIDNGENKPKIDKSQENNEDVTYSSTLLHIRIVELEQEIASFKQENRKLVTIRKKLQVDKEKLSNELSEFELLKSNERKKIEEEKRRIKRDQNLLDKSKKMNKKCEKCNELKIEKETLEKEFRAKELKMSEEISKLKEQLKKVRRENQELDNDNKKYKLKNVNSKVNIVSESVPEVLITNHQVDHPKNEEVSSVSKITSNSSKTFSEGTQIREKIFDDGHKEIWYDNGNRKEVSFGGKHSKIFYFNGDVKEILENGTQRYLYSETQTWHTKLNDGTEIIQFNNGQQETKTADGNTSISFPDGTNRNIDSSGRETISYPDGTLVNVQVNGDRKLKLPNGQVEEHTALYKKRIYPDGTVKTLFSDGRQETRYANGRVRIRDAGGNLVQDSG